SSGGGRTEPGCRGRRKAGRWWCTWALKGPAWKRDAPHTRVRGMLRAGWSRPRRGRRLGYPIGRIESARSAGGLHVLELVMAGGWPMIPLLVLSALALAIIVERAWALRRATVLPPGLGKEVRTWA